MRWIVVVHRDSPIGRGYEEKLVKARVGNEAHPAFVCDELDAGGNYLFVRTVRNDQQSRQALHIPHSSVLFMIQFDDREPPPIGFVYPAK